MAMAKTKSVYDPVEPSDGDRVLVARYWPRGISKARLCLAEWIMAYYYVYALDELWEFAR